MGFWYHYKALLYKNWIVWKRNLCCSCCELCLPIALMFLIVIIRRSISATDEPAEGYLSHARTVEIQANLTWGQLFPQCVEYAREQESWTVMLAPEGAPVVTAMSLFFQSLKLPPDLNITVQVVPDNSYVEDYVTDGDYEDGPKLCFAVVFDSITNLKFDYQIRFNQTKSLRNGKRQMGSNQEIFQTENSPIDSITRRPTSYQDDFIKTGFLTIQNWVDNYVLHEITGSTTSAIVPTFIPMHFDEYIDDSFMRILTQVLPVFIIITYVIPVSRMIMHTVGEKETRIKEVMMMMGLSNSAYWLSWITYYLSIYTVIAGVITIITSFSVFKYSEKGYIFLFFWLFGISCIAFCFLIQTFFSRARTAFLIGIMLFLAQYFVSMGMTDADENGKNGVSLLPPAAFALACNNLGNYEAGRIGITRTTTAETFENYKFSTALGFFILDTIIFTVLGIYFEQVWPNEYGVKKPWYFPVLPKYWRCRRRHVSEGAVKKKVKWGENVEEVDEALEQQKDQGKAMMVRGLTKHFGTKVAVDALDLDIFEGQIFALLGHNGAGKTTTISMLTGLLRPTAGEMMVGDQLLSENLSEIRKRLGVCPQHNVLFKELTVAEHLYVFSVFKGQKDKKLIQAKAEEIIAAVDLGSQMKTRADRLSGGQKRKLSLAIALIGESQIILLDEPTAGMDITARRQMWDMLKNSKAGKIILLTTHYMEEADILADRIAIISDGKMKCCGSPLYLKSRFGVGYYLNLVKQPGLMSSEHSKQVITFVKSFVGSAKVLNDIPGEIAFQMPLSEVSHFKDMFADLDQRMESLGLHSYGISVTTLEEVFLRVASGAGTRPLAATSEQRKLDNSAELENQPLTQREPIDFTLAHDRLKGSTLCMHIQAMLRKRFLTSMRDVKSLVFEIFIPIALVLFGLGLMLVATRFKELPEYDLTIDQYPTKQSIYYSNSFDPTVIAVMNKAKSTGLITAKGVNPSSVELFDNTLFEERDTDPYRMGSYFFLKMDPEKDRYEPVVFHNQTAYQACPTYYQFISTAILQTINPNVRVTVHNSPLPLTSKVKALNGVGAGFIASTIFSLGFAFIPTGIIGLIVKEREMAIKHQHMVSGVSLPAYWLTNYVWDFSKHFIPAVICSLCVLAFQIDSLVNPSDSYGALWLIMILYGFATSSFTYLTSFMFPTSSTAQMVTLLLNFIAGCVCPSVVFLLRALGYPNPAKVLMWLFRFEPNFCFGMGILNIGSREIFATFDGLKDPYEAFDVDSAGGDILMLAITAVLYLLLIYAMELNQLHPHMRKCLKKSLKYDLHNAYEPDDDVEREAAESENTLPKDAQLVIRKLRQVYRNLFSKPVLGVDEVSFTVGFKETFALLGVNGAGKTSTFRMLTGEYAATEGDAYVCGESISSSLTRIRKVIGYCPQFDALSEMLTGRELLEIYADMKGIPRHMRTAMVTEIMTELDLLKYEKVRCGTYSGGNKRKLSVAMALLGNPSVVFLDEPSAGMDPEARKKMWNVIGNIKKRNAAIVLTTHSMEEAESLCDRIAIMVAGRIRCIGTSTHIKNKFGSGYEVEIKVQIPTRQQVEGRVKSLNRILHPNSEVLQESQLKRALEELGHPDYEKEVVPTGKGAAIYNQLRSDKIVPAKTLVAWVITEEYGDAIENYLHKTFAKVKLIEHYLSFYKFKVEKQPDKSLGALFSAIEGSKTQLSISEYSVNQTSLEQIFNQFARMGGHIPE